jgi:hypothetical protein
MMVIILGRRNGKNNSNSSCINIDTEPSLIKESSE